MSTTSDLALLRRKLAASDYAPQVYVRELANRCVGGHELLLQRQNIQTLSEDTHAQLKKNVYDNYKLFMTTSKEIQYLESDMYQLSNMITKQRNILQEMSETSILGDKINVSEMCGADNEAAEAEKVAQEEKANLREEFDKGRRQLYDLLERVEGCSHVTDVPTRYLLYDGDLVEMDINENSALHRVHGYLMNDGFMVATWLATRRGPVRFKFSCMYELDSLAIVNVRDLSGIKHAFKLLVFPEARLFQCANAASKQEWMDAFENAKKRRQKEQETQALKRSNTIAKKKSKHYKERMASYRRKNPFLSEVSESAVIEDEDEGKETLVDESQDSDESDEFELEDWISELPDELEVFIAQREFEQAVSLIFKANKYFKDNPNKVTNREHQKKIEQRKKNLIEVLKSELSERKSVQGGPRAARRAVQLLSRLGSSTLACQLFLQHRSAILKTNLKNIKLESATINYIQRLSMSFFNSLLETLVEFKRAFSGLHSNKGSSFLTWISQEFESFYERVDKQIFSPSTPLEVIASSVSFIRDQACSMQNCVDIVYLIDSKFRRNVEKTICEHRDKHVEAVKLRAQEDKWEPINCFNRSGTERFIEEMSTAGIKSIRALIFDDCWIGLTRNTSSFSLSYLGFVDSLIKLYNPSLRSLINESLVTVFHSHLRHIEQAIRLDKTNNANPKFIQGNCAFLLDTLLSLVESKYSESTNSDCPKLGKLHSSYKWLKEGQKPKESKANDSKNQDPNYV